MTADTTAPAADDLREAIVMITDSFGTTDDILALIAPRIAAAREQGRREGIEAAVMWHETERSAALVNDANSSEAWRPSLYQAISVYHRDCATAIRALADAPRLDAAETEGG